MGLICRSDEILNTIIFILSCAKQPCTTSATCNDGRLEFGDKCELCKGVGIKYIYDCERKIINC